MNSDYEKRVDTAENTAECVVCGSRESVEIYHNLTYRKGPSCRYYRMSLCSFCHLLYVYPRPEESLLLRLYSDRNYRADELSARMPRECMVEMDVLRRIQRYQKPGRVLDVGCGAGHFLSCMRQVGWQVYGVEIAAHSAQFARECYELPVVPTLQALEQPPESFDLVTLLGVIEHVQQPLEFLRELCTFVKPGGIVFILTDNHKSWMHWLMKDRFPWIIPPEHLQLFTPRTASILFQLAGLQPFKIESKETIFPDAAVRGIAAVLGSRVNGREVNSVLKMIITPVLWAMYPVRRLLWRANLGAQIYCFGRKPGEV